MTFIYFIRLIIKNLLWLVGIPAIMAGSVFYFTRAEKKIYSSESVIYTGIASGYSLSGNNKADFFETSNAFDNLLSLINSRVTKQEVVINLLSRHLMIKKHYPEYFSWDTFDQLRKLVPDSIRQMLVKPTLKETIVAVEQYMNGKEGNLIYTIINSENPYYSLSAMDKIKALRINNSDLIRISYQSTDAVTCMQTLQLLEETFMKKHRMLKEDQSASVVDYFEAETKSAFARLNAAEQVYMEFNKEHDIINYYEQTRAVAIEKENLDVLNHNMEMNKMANGKSLDKVNETMKGRLYKNEYGAQLLKDRELLSDVKSKITIGEIIGKREAGYQQQMDSLRTVAALLDRQLKESVNNLYMQTLTPAGIPTQIVLDEWLKNSLEFEQSRAKLTVMDKRKKEFAEEYRKYAPLGAMLKKIERQINVSEQEYLELLHGLNMAKLTQQNNELTSKLNIVDPPYLPLKANTSKRMLQVVIGFIVGFVLVLASVLFRALVNKTLQQPGRARKIIGIPLLGIYPLLNARSNFLALANVRLAQQFLAQIDINTKPVTIGCISIQNNEGKSTIVELLTKELALLNYTVENQSWHGNINATESARDFLLVEFPALDTMIIKPGTLPKLHYTILVCRANRIWNKLDSALLNIFSKTTGNHPSLLLNGVKREFAESSVGEVPGKKFTLHALFKRLLKFEFGNRNNIT